MHFLFFSFGTYFFLGQNATEKMPKLNIKNKCFGVARWMYRDLDDIDLLCKICVLSNCSEIQHCTCCRHLLKWCMDILMNRWGEIRSINFWDAMKIVKDNKDLFSEDIYLHYWE